MRPVEPWNINFVLGRCMHTFELGGNPNGINLCWKIEYTVMLKVVDFGKLCSVTIFQRDHTAKQIIVSGHGPSTYYDTVLLLDPEHPFIVRYHRCKLFKLPLLATINKWNMARIDVGFDARRKEVNTIEDS